MTLIDTHSHLYGEEFDADREQVLARAVSAGVGRILLPAIDAQSHERLFDLCRRHPQHCVPMMGLHPTSVNRCCELATDCAPGCEEHNAHPSWRDQLALVERYLATPPAGIDRFCAVGEIGLDLYWSRDFVAEQQEAFRYQIDLSLRYDLPVAIHVRDAWAETLAVMRDYRGRGVRGVFHAWSGDVDAYRELKTYGDFLFGIGGVVTFKKSMLAEVVGQMELQDMVLETDSPYLTPAPHRGTRNEPAYVRYVCERIAQIKACTPEQVAVATTENATRIFNTK